jgi:hypothetical protein
MQTRFEKGNYGRIASGGWQFFWKLHFQPPNEFLLVESAVFDRVQKESKGDRSSTQCKFLSRLRAHKCIRGFGNRPLQVGNGCVAISAHKRVGQTCKVTAILIGTSELNEQFSQSEKVLRVSDPRQRNKRLLVRWLWTCSHLP